MTPGSHGRAPSRPPPGGPPARAAARAPLDQAGAAGMVALPMIAVRTRWRSVASARRCPCSTSGAIEQSKTRAVVPLTRRPGSARLRAEYMSMADAPMRPMRSSSLTPREVCFSLDPRDVEADRMPPEDTLLDFTRLLVYWVLAAIGVWFPHPKWVVSFLLAGTAIVCLVARRARRCRAARERTPDRCS